MRGRNLLLARRLVEAGVPFINVNDFKQQGHNWDTHADNFGQHKDHLLPPMDRGFSALVEDLDARGLLDSTLVVALGEFGRTPKINKDAGRDHWPSCYTVALAGGGVRGGAVFGASDRFAAYPSSDPVTPADLAATIFWRFGLDPASEIRDAQDRPYKLADGEPITALFA
jgi:arylsulfatase A-like enzyme